MFIYAFIIDMGLVMPRLVTKSCFQANSAKLASERTKEQAMD